MPTNLYVAQRDNRANDSGAVAAVKSITPLLPSFSDTRLLPAWSQPSIRHVSPGAPDRSGIGVLFAFPSGDSKVRSVTACHTAHPPTVPAAAASASLHTKPTLRSEYLEGTQPPFAWSGTRLGKRGPFPPLRLQGRHCYRVSANCLTTLCPAASAAQAPVLRDRMAAVWALHSRVGCSRTGLEPSEMSPRI